MIVRPMKLKQANEFVDTHHRHNKPARGHLFSIAAIEGEEINGVAIVSRPVARALDDGVTAEVVRCCVLESAQKGTCSFLYARAWKIWSAMGGQVLITYTLTEESGASLRGAGWKVVHKCRRHKGWIHSGVQREHQDVYLKDKQRWEIRV